MFKSYRIFVDINNNQKIKIMNLTTQQIAELEKLFNLFISEDETNKELALSMDYDGLLKDEIERYQVFFFCCRNRREIIIDYAKDSQKPLPYTANSLALRNFEALSIKAKSAIEKSNYKLKLMCCSFNKDIDIAHIEDEISIDSCKIKSIGMIKAKTVVIHYSDVDFELCEGIENLELNFIDCTSVKIPTSVKHLKIVSSEFENIPILSAVPQLPINIETLTLMNQSITQADLSQYKNLKYVSLTGNPIEFLKLPKGCQVKI